MTEDDDRSSFSNSTPSAERVKKLEKYTMVRDSYNCKSEPCWSEPHLDDIAVV
jgi:hypothetical protein